MQNNIETIMQIRECHRERARVNYQKRKEAGTLKKYYIKKGCRIKKDIPTEEEAAQMKCIINKQIAKVIKTKVNEDEYKLLLKEREELNSIKQGKVIITAY